MSTSISKILSHKHEMEREARNERIRRSERLGGQWTKKQRRLRWIDVNLQENRGVEIPSNKVVQV